MPSSIFNFDLLRAFARLPARRQAWHALILAGFAGICAAGVRLQLQLSGRAAPATIRTLAVQALSPRTEAVFLGNSVVEAAIDSSRYPAPVMALPMANGNYEVDEIILRSQLPRLTGLKTVIMQLDATCLGWDRLGITIDFSAFRELGVPVSDIPRPWWWRARQNLFELPWLRALLFGERMTPRALVWDRTHAASRLPPEPGYTRLTGTLLEHDRIRYFTKDPVKMWDLDPAIIRKNENAVRRIATLLRARGVRLVFLRYPTRGGYNFFHFPEWDAVVASFQERLGEITGGTAVVLDLADDPAFTTSDFRDTIHLNQRGAAVLARELPPRLRQLPAPPEP